MEFLNDQFVIVLEALVIIVLAMCLYRSETRLLELGKSINATTNVGVGFDPLTSGRGETMIGVAAFKNIQQAYGTEKEPEPLIEKK